MFVHFQINSCCTSESHFLKYNINNEYIATVQAIKILKWKTKVKTKYLVLQLDVFYQKKKKTSMPIYWSHLVFHDKI